MLSFTLDDILFKKLNVAVIYSSLMTNIIDLACVWHFVNIFLLLLRKYLLFIKINFNLYFAQHSCLWWNIKDEMSMSIHKCYNLWVTSEATLMKTPLAFIWIASALGGSFFDDLQNDLCDIANLKSPYFYVMVTAR